MIYQPLGVPTQQWGRVHFENYAVRFWRETISPPHAHRFVELYLVVRGRAKLVVSGRPLPMTAGSLLVVPPATEHFLLEPSADLRRWSFAMRTAAARRTLADADAQQLLQRAPAPGVVRLTRADAEDLAQLMSDVSRVKPEELALVNAGIAHVLARAAVASRAAERIEALPAVHPAVARALSLMTGDGLRLGRAELAAACGLGESHLSRLFVRELGQSLSVVRNRRRLYRFAELMESGRERTLLEAALEAGFGSYAQFHRVHLKLLGTRPVDSWRPG